MTPAASYPREDGAARALAERQARLAEWLTASAPVPETEGFDGVALSRTRSVLAHKRVDDALPLLPRTAARGEAARAAALAALRGVPRAARRTGVADAFRIAESAAALPGLAAAAGRDLLELRARFVARGGAGARPRLGLFVGRRALPGGRAVWALKGPGRQAGVRLFEFGGEP